MKKIIFFTFLIGLFAGCSHSKPPDFQGRIIDIKESRVLVVSNVSIKELETRTQTQLLNDKAPNAVWINVSSINKYKVGQLLEVWYQGGVDTSYPAQAGAKKVEIIEEPRRLL
ncbi:YobA family protein [Paenibacillus sp. GCM10027629]|uniref:YobA family protein n=1 Tax=Paenibacillus sp. GCM10027629 TaxID=3273414 RepID=UPI003642001D